MGESLSERRMAENEVLFREYNERIEKDFDELKQLAIEDSQEEFINNDDTPLHFYCECSDEGCRKRVILKPSHYNQIHQRRDHFVVVCGHEVKTIEQVIEKDSNFCVIEKFTQPPKTATKFNKTATNNS